MGMEQLPAPDIRDTQGRARRIVLALLIGAACAGIAYAVATALIDPAADKPAYRFGKAMSAGGFILWVTGISGVVGVGLALAVQNALARRAWRAERVPTATARPPT